MRIEKKVCFSKEAAVKNYKKFTEDADLLKALLEDEGKEIYTQEEITEMLKKELKREVG